jgi:hypothetical protein
MAADYAFIEVEPGVTRYEVRCRTCGEVYSEDSAALVLAAVGGDEPLMQWPPDCEPVAPRDWRNDIRHWLESSARRGRLGVELVGARAQALAEHARGDLSGRLRGVRANQTGG